MHFLSRTFTDTGCYILNKYIASAFSKILASIRVFGIPSDTIFLKSNILPVDTNSADLQPRQDNQHGRRNLGKPSENYKIFKIMSS